jgi:hypothetical protein
VAIRFRQKDILRECLSAFAKLYRTPASDEVFRRFPRSDGTAFLLWTWFWRAVMTRVYAFGGYAVLRESFQSVRIIARTGVQPVTAGTPRQPLISDPDWDYRSRGHLQYFEEAGHYLERKAAVLKLLPEEATQALDYVCRFDLLVDYSLHLERIPNPFPNFAIHYPQRTMPIIEQIITEPSQVWGTDFDGVEFARFLDTIPQRMVGMKFAPRWRAYISKLVRGFPDENR